MNGVQFVPNEICSLVNLKKLNLIGNRINKVVNCVEELLVLEYLGLGNSSLDIGILETLRDKLSWVIVDL